MQNNLGLNLAKLRKKNRYSRKVIAQFLGVNEMTIGAYERGEKNPPIDRIIQLAEFFKISLDVLVCGDVDDFEKSDEVKLNLSDEKLTFDVPADKRDLLLVALPYAGKVINSVMSAVQEVEKSRQVVEVTYSFTPTGLLN